MPDMNEFLELAHRAGIGTLNSLAIAEALEISTSYVAKLRSGVEPVRPPIRAKLEALSAAKDNGPETDPWPAERDALQAAADAKGPETVEQFEVDIPAPKRPMTAGGISSPVRRYEVVSTPTGEIKIAEILADCKVWSHAQRICDLLNKERD